MVEECTQVGFPPSSVTDSAILSVGGTWLREKKVVMCLEVSEKNVWMRWNLNGTLKYGWNLA